MTDRRTPPNDREAERSVLGSMLRDNSVIADVASVLDVGDYYVAAHQTLHAIIFRLWETQQPADLVTVGGVLKTRGDVGDIGGYAYLAELWDATPTSANAGYYAKIVRETAIRRRLIQIGNEISRDAQDGVSPADELIEAAEKKVFQLSEMGADGEAKHISLGVSEVRDRLDRIGKGELQVGIKTGLGELDDRIVGFKAGELIVIGARTSVGKTALALHFTAIAAENSHTALVVSLEMSREELAGRLLSRQANVSGSQITRGVLKNDEFTRIADACDIIDNLPIYVLDTPNVTALKIAANARRLQQRLDLKMLVVDYIQMLEPEDRRVSRHEQVATMSRRLKNLARELKIPIIVLAQLNRQVEGRQDGKPRTSDIRESDAIAHDADVVMLLWRPEEGAGVQGNAIPLEIVLAKQRNGWTGDVRVDFYRDTMTFADQALPYMGGPPIG